MAGHWIDGTPDHAVRVSCRWSPDGDFLLRNDTVRPRGKAAMTVHQRLG